MPRRTLTALALLLVAAGLLYARGAPRRYASSEVRAGDDRLAAADSLVREWVSQGRVPGAVLMVARDGVVLLERAHGWARRTPYRGDGYVQWRASGVAAGLPDAEVIDSTVPLVPVEMTTETIFDLASVTKVMATTMGVMLLVEDGRLELDTPISAYLPEFTGEGRDRITPEHLLTHRSGLPQWLPTYYHATESDGAYRYLLEVPLAWPVDSERHYSDLGFMLLGRLVERLAGQSLDTFLAERLYEPLGLRSTGFRSRSGQGPHGPFAATSQGNPFEYRMVHDSTFGYRIGGDPYAWDAWRKRTLEGEANDANAFHAFGGVAGHAGLFSTARDLQALLRLLLEGGEADGTRYFSRRLVDEFLTERIDGQALGWQVPPFAPPGSFSHTGFTGTYVLGVRQRGLAVILLTNRQHGDVDASTTYPDVAPLQKAVTEILTR